MSKARSIGLWVSLGLTSLAFAAAGIGKLMGVEQMHMSFAAMGLPVAFGYFIGASEIAGAVGLWLRELRVYAAAGLLVIIVGAIYFHLVYEAAANAVPAVVLGALLITIIIIGRKSQNAE